MAIPSRAAPWWLDRRERLPGGWTAGSNLRWLEVRGLTDESGPPVAVPSRAEPWCMDRGFGDPVAGPWGSNLRWLNRGAGSPVVGPRDGFIRPLAIIIFI